ncbi:hypothetical protein FE257_006893 [Aspergillus nanangensis]|uniref:Uncharacterized protein n=1 Tax=Aspergillus nanangensis TaxID=2582783 RepID=A0AAD4CQ79_ASPNN|nr:hypothetical protein FE257_006893 [Aspergillus nanangensis]
MGWRTTSLLPLDFAVPVCASNTVCEETARRYGVGCIKGLSLKTTTSPSTDAEIDMSDSDDKQGIAGGVEMIAEQTKLLVKKLPPRLLMRDEGEEALEDRSFTASGIEENDDMLPTEEDVENEPPTSQDSASASDDDSLY